MLDVHVLVMDYTPKDQIDRCFKSIHDAVDRAGFPVFVHRVAGVVGHLGKARLKGYSQGSAEYVTHVDDDDWVEPDAFSALFEHMEEGAEAITTGENHVHEKASIENPGSKHHLAVYRREFVESLGYDAFRFYPDQYILSMCDPVHIPKCLYNHRIHPNSGSRRQRRENEAEANKELEVIRRPDLAILETATPQELAAAIDRELRRA